MSHICRACGCCSGYSPFPLVSRGARELLAASYGHLQTMLDTAGKCVDEFMYWADKDEVEKDRKIVSSGRRIQLDIPGCDILG